MGLRDAEIVFDTVYQIDDKNLVIDLTINEGKYYLEYYMDGKYKYRSSYLDTILGIKREIFTISLF